MRLGQVDGELQRGLGGWDDEDRGIGIGASGTGGMRRDEQAEETRIR